MHHFNSKTKNGYYTISHKFARKKLKHFNANLKEWLKNNRNVLKFVEFMKVLDTKLTGMYHYYGVNGTMPYLKAFHNHAFFATFKWL